MANEPFPRINRQMSDGTITSENLESAINREVVPLLFEIRERLARFTERPQIPVFESSPITDADFDPSGTRPPADGVMAISSATGALYVRVGGVYAAYT